MPTDEPAEIGLETAVELVDEVLGEAGVSRADVIGVGVGLPGPIDMSSGRVGSSSILPGWVGVRAAPRRSRRAWTFRCRWTTTPTSARLPSSTGARPPAIGIAAYLKVSTGIGAGLIVDGRLFHGADGMAGEIGHTIIQEHGPFCRCGKRGCLETLAGAAALVELLQATHGPELTTQQLLDAAAAGDSAARRVLADAGRYIGNGGGHPVRPAQPRADRCRGPAERGRRRAAGSAARAGPPPRHPCHVTPPGDQSRASWDRERSCSARSRSCSQWAG